MDRILSTSHWPVRNGPGLLRRLVGAMGLRRSRHRLGELDDHLLKDIGLTRMQAGREATRPSWDAPAHWLR